MALKKHCSSLSNRVQTLLPHATNTYIPTYYYCMCIYRIVVKKKQVTYISDLSKGFGQKLFKHFQG